MIYLKVTINKVKENYVVVLIKKTEKHQLNIPRQYLPKNVTAGDCLEISFKKLKKKRDNIASKFNDRRKGTKEDPYKIYTPKDLLKITKGKYTLDSYYKLMNDIDFKGTKIDTKYEYKANNLNPKIVFEPSEVINKEDCKNSILKNYVKFEGELNGNGYEIRNLTIITFNHFLEGGLFNKNKGKIKKLKLKNVKIKGDGGYGQSALVGLNEGEIVNCKAINCCVEGNNCVGGLVGENKGTIKESNYNGKVKSGLVGGGLVGVNSGKITNCYSSGEIKASDSIGKLIGRNTGEVKGSASISALKTKDYQFADGLIGENYGGKIDFIKKDLCKVELENLKLYIRVVNKKTGKLIVENRNKLNNLENLKQIKGIGPKTYQSLEARFFNLNIDRQNGCGSCNYIRMKDNCFVCVHPQTIFRFIVSLDDIENNNDLIKIPSWCQK
jgi:hypothetical protein